MKRFLPQSSVCGNGRLFLFLLSGKRFPELRQAVVLKFEINMVFCVLDFYENGIRTDFPAGRIDAGIFGIFTEGYDIFLVADDFALWLHPIGIEKYKFSVFLLEIKSLLGLIKLLSARGYLFADGKGRIVDAGELFGNFADCGIVYLVVLLADKRRNGLEHFSCKYGLGKLFPVLQK